MGLVWFYFPLQSTLKINLVFDQLSNPFWALCLGFPNWIKELGALRSHLCWALGVGTKSSWSGWHALELLKWVACTWAPEGGGMHLSSWKELVLIAVTPLPFFRRWKSLESVFLCASAKQQDFSFFSFFPASYCILVPSCPQASGSVALPAQK